MHVFVHKISLYDLSTLLGATWCSQHFPSIKMNSFNPRSNMLGWYSFLVFQMRKLRHWQGTWPAHCPASEQWSWALNPGIWDEPSSGCLQLQQDLSLGFLPRTSVLVRLCSKNTIVTVSLSFYSKLPFILPLPPFRKCLEQFGGLNF